MKYDVQWYCMIIMMMIMAIRYVWPVLVAAWSGDSGMGYV